MNRFHGFTRLLRAFLAAPCICKAPPVVPAAGGGYYQGVAAGNLSTSFPEPSGIARPNEPANRAFLWMLQDSGGPSSLLAVNASDASTAGSWQVGTSPAANVDWEDFCSARVGGVNYLYVGDTGDNASSRDTIIIYRCIEPVITGSNGTIPDANITTITCQFPAPNLPAHKDCECIMADPRDGTLYFITKRIFPAKIYSLPHQASYAGTQTLTYVGSLAADSSATSLTIGTGSKVFTTVFNLAYAPGTRLRAASAANAANFMEGDVTSVSGSTLTLNVDATGGSGTLADWQIGLANSPTPTPNPGCVTGGTISPDRTKVVLCNYGNAYPGPAGKGGTGMFLWNVAPTQSIGAALAGPPVLLTADTGGGANYAHSNPPSFPQREAVEFGWDGTTLYAIGEYYSTYGATTNPLVKYTPCLRMPVTLVLQNGLNGYSGATDTYVFNTSPAADNSAVNSLVSDTNLSTFSAVSSAASGAKIDVTTSTQNVTDCVIGTEAQISGSSVPAYNGFWVVDSKPSGTVVRLNCAFSATATGTLYSTIRQGLLKFSDLSGIPAGSTIVGAKLVLYINTEGSAFQLNRMKVPWLATDTWNSLTSGVSLNDTDAAVTPDANIIKTAPDGYTGFYTFNIQVGTVQGWVDGAIPNHGWLIGGDEPAGDGFQWDSSESSTQARKPMLIIRYTAP